MRRWAALSLGLFAAAGCGSNPPADPTVVPLGDWGREAAAVECAQIFACCDAAERMALRYTDEAQCREMLADLLQSEVCNNGTGAAPSPCWNLTCDVGQYCEPALPGCAPVNADGAACADNSECTPPSVCMSTTGVCGPPLPDGAACAVRGDCASSNCSSGVGSTQICYPRICDGA